MFFEDEKDIIKEGTEIRVDDDGTVTWEDVLSSDEELSSYDISNQLETNELEDELQIVQDSDDDVNDEELIKILNNAQNDNTNDYTAPDNYTEDNTYTQSSEYSGSDEDFDIDKQLANVVSEHNQTGSDGVTPRKMEQKTKSSSSIMPFLLLVLLVVVIAGGIYYGMEYFGGNQNLDQPTLDRPATYQEQLNENLNQEVLQQRQQEENIPVVNEEDAANVQPEEEKEQEEPKKEEKKQVINVIPTGRTNPFLPIAKYATSKVSPDAEIDFSLTDIPKPPEEYGIEEETEKLMSIAVSGIMYDEIKPSAIITYDNNDYFVQKGDMLDDYKIVDIGKNYVSILQGTNVYRANIGEEFKIGSDFYGSAQFVADKKGNVRHYQTVQSDKNAKDNGGLQKLRYVSEEEITIKAR